jgi:hypothetical protein
MNGNDSVGQLVLVLAAAYCFGAAIFAKSFRRRRFNGPDPHPGRWRFALAALGLATLLLWFSETSLQDNQTPTSPWM